MIKRWYHQIFVAPKQYAVGVAALQALMPGLLEFRQKLLRLEYARCSGRSSVEKLDLTVTFFRLSSSWFDQIGDLAYARLAFEAGGQHRNSQEIQEQLFRLIIHLRNAGRDESGYNRTKHGEQVTADNIYLGDRCGLWTKTIRYWQSQADDQSEVTRSTSGVKMTVCDVIWLQANDFMTSHVSPMADAISKLNSLVEEERKVA